jgi:polyisoprenoid-binding protein YceI
MTVPTVSKHLTLLAAAGLWFMPGMANAEVERYALDPGHSFVTFSISHLGYSMLQGRFNDLEGSFEYDTENPAGSSVKVVIKTASVDTNHAERDKHLRDADFLNVDMFPEASFESTSFVEDGDTGVLTGNLTLHGVTRPIDVDVTFVGAGQDPWGGYRRGYIGRTTLRRSDFDMSYDLGPAAEEMTLEFNIEGIRQ